MDRNEHLSEFFKSERKRQNMSVADMAAAGGFNYANYYNWESNGRLPRAPEMQERLARQFGLTREELLEKACVASHDQHNLLPLIRAIAKTKCPAVTLADIQFLCETQADLSRQLEPEIIEELMKYR